MAHVFENHIPLFNALTSSWTRYVQQIG